MVEIGSLATSPTAENRIAEAFKIEMQDSARRRNSAGLTRKQAPGYNNE